MYKTNKGFTLVELITCVAILGLIMVTLGGAMFATFEAWGRHRTRERMSRYESQTRLALLGMVRDIRLSTYVVNDGLRDVPTVGSNNGDVMVLRARLGTNAYRTITYTLEDNPSYDAAAIAAGATRVPRHVLVRTVSDPHGAGGSGAASPPPGGGAWSEWPVNFSHAFLDDVHVIPVNVPAGTLVFPGGIPAGTDLSGVVEHVNIRLIPDEDLLYVGQLEDSLFVDEDSAIITFFSTTTALRRIPG